jgi:hypothetical protein
VISALAGIAEKRRADRNLKRRNVGIGLLLRDLADRSRWSFAVFGQRRHDLSEAHFSAPALRSSATPEDPDDGEGESSPGADFV